MRDFNVTGCYIFAKTTKKKVYLKFIKSLFLLEMGLGLSETQRVKFSVLNL